MPADPVHFETREDGIVIPVRAKPAARHNGVDGIHNGAVRVSVTAAPEKGKANRAIGELLAKLLGVSKSQVVLIAGETSSHKRFLVTGRELDEVRLALQEWAED